MQLRELEADADLLERARTRLWSLHDAAGMPLAQSLRGGSQTRGVLFHRPEPVLLELQQAILSTLQSYRNDLPKCDPKHPLLHARDTAWQLAGSWSVRLGSGGDRHAAHIHPAGLISSALYLSLPTAVEGAQREGWLEIGRPPADLGLELEPLVTIQPKQGHMALFPSTLYHGTTPFGAGQSKGERLTVAFDVITKTH